MQNAINDVKSRRLSMYSAAKEFAETFRRHLSNPHVKMVAAHPTVLSSQEELENIECCKLFSTWGFGLTKVDVLNVVAEYLHHSKKPNPFKVGWGFWQRVGATPHEASSRTVKKKATSTPDGEGKGCHPEHVTHWFNERLKPTLDRLNLHGKPQCIYNVDESGFL